MKKLLVTGIVTLALAVVPVASSFAATTTTDTLNVTVSTNCNISGGATRSGSGGTNALINVSGGAITITCNGAKGYTAKLKSATALTNTTSSSYTIPYYTSTPPAAGVGAWAAYIGSETSPVAIGGTIKSTTGPDASTSGSSVTMNYKVGTTTTQAAGTYSGTATYEVTVNS